MIGSRRFSISDVTEDVAEKSSCSLRCTVLKVIVSVLSRPGSVKFTVNSSKGRAWVAVRTRKSLPVEWIWATSVMLVASFSEIYMCMHISASAIAGRSRCPRRLIAPLGRSSFTITRSNLRWSGRLAGRDLNPSLPTVLDGFKTSSLQLASRADPRTRVKVGLSRSSSCFQAVSINESCNEE